MVVIFIGGGNHSTQRKPPTCHKSLTIKLYHIFYTVHLTMSRIQTQNFIGDTVQSETYHDKSP